MIPLIDDYLQLFIAEKLKFLKNNPSVIDSIFRTGRRETLDKLKDFIENRKIRVVIGYPREQSSLPCYVITLAPEHEQPVGLGDDSETFASVGLGDEYSDDVIIASEEKLSEFLASTYMNSTYRIECWSDNGDLTSYMYVILKWCLWSSRQQMLNMGWVNVTLSGLDLEPAPDYMPIFIYRRSAQISLMYENLYYEEIENLDKYVDIIQNPDDYHKDEYGNIVDADGNIIIPASYLWVISAHYYQKAIGDNSHLFKDDKVIHGITRIISKTQDEEVQGFVVDTAKKLPDVGDIDSMYIVLNMNDSSEPYTSYIWNSDKYVKVAAKDSDLSSYKKIVVIRSSNNHI